METQQVAHRFVQAEVLRLHSNPQDFDEGDLLHRLDQFNAYIRKSIPVEQINLNEFALCEEVVTEYMDLYMSTQTYPPLVFNAISNSMIDGLHRANALARLGLTQIDCYVGTAQTADPFWQVDIDEDAGDDE